MRKPEEIPESERRYPFEGREDIFEADGRKFIFMGKWAGWQEFDEIFLLPGGNVSARKGEFPTEKAAKAGGAILRAMTA